MAQRGVNIRRMIKLLRRAGPRLDERLRGLGERLDVVELLGRLREGAVHRL